MKIEQDLSAIQTELANMRRLHAVTLQQLAAEKKFKETQEKFNSLREGKPWDDKILNYQWDDVTYMTALFEAGKTGVLNANDMGLGKTAETAFFFDIIIPLFNERYGRHPQILWLTKKTLRYSSLKELMRWNDDRKYIVLDGLKDTREFQLSTCCSE
jgi:SNF2 family DNA or RNA helicase